MPGRAADLAHQNLLLYSEIGFWTEVCREKLPQAHFLFMNEWDAFGELVGLGAFLSFVTDAFAPGQQIENMWSDFDETHGTLSIRRTIHTQKGGRLVAGETKTGTGKRTIILPPSTAQLLAQRKKYSYSQWIFPNPLRPEQPASPGTAYNHLKTLLKRAGLPSIRFHDLRHTFATHALASGVDAKTLSGILGHTQASFTLDTYTHVTGDMQKRASEIVGGFMENIMVR